MPAPNRPLDTIGASDIVAICGFSPYVTPHDVAHRIVGHNDWGIASNPELAEWGHIMEPAILNHWEKYVGGVQLTIRGKSYFHPEIAWMAATPDGVNPERPAIVDAKNVDWSKASRFKNGLPDDFIVQGTWQVGVYNAVAEKENLPKATEAFFHCAIGNRPPNQYPIPFDQAAFDKLVIIATNFREKVLRGDFDFGTQVTIEQLSGKDLKQANKRQAQLLARYMRLRQKDSENTVKMSLLEEQIKEIIGQNYGIQSDQFKAIFPEYGGGIAYAKIVNDISEKFKIPISEIEELKKKYRSAPSRRLTVKELR